MEITCMCQVSVCDKADIVKSLGSGCGSLYYLGHLQNERERGAGAGGSHLTSEICACSFPAPFQDEPFQAFR